MMKTNKSIAVIGGGVAGITSALELANSGYTVHLIEKEATIGGQAAAFCCKATDSCTKCSACLLPQKLNDVVSHPRISILTNATVTGVNGDKGDFRLEVERKSHNISTAECIACGLCLGVCPTKPKAIIAPAAEAVPYAYSIDESQCLRLKGEQCHLCQEACPTNAVIFEDKAQRQELEVGSIIVATGFEVFNAKELGCLNYGRYPDIITGLDMEKMFRNQGTLTLSANGKGKGKAPKRIAFIQCVGSRTEEHNYCSQVCCKYAIRLARLITYQNPEAEVTVFYIDLQTAGKGFAQFYQEAKDSVRFVRGVPIEATRTPSGALEVRFENIVAGKVERETFDMVTLSVGIAPRKDAWNLAKVLGISMAEDGFFATDQPCDSTETNVDGIFLAGACQGPKDIPDSIAHGISAAERAMEVLQRCE